VPIIHLLLYTYRYIMYNIIIIILVIHKVLVIIIIITYTDKSTRVSLDLIRRPSQMHVDS
jgi:hypothetical protein